VSPSASVAVPSKLTATGAVPVVGVAVTATVGGAFSVMPRPRKSTQLTLRIAPVPVAPTGLRATKNSGPLAVLGVSSSAVALAKVCQPPVSGTLAVASTGPSTAPARTSIRAPPPAEEARNRNPVIPVRLVGSKVQ
jgi:hypothetical protein